MSIQVASKALLIAAGIALSGAVVAKDRVDVGKLEYENNCAVCHGEKGNGGGSYVELLKRAPADLTTLAKANGGVFPFDRAYAVIEGAGVGHGTRDMPIWGRTYRIEAAEYYVDVPYSPQAYVRSRILALIEYINRLQVK